VNTTVEPVGITATWYEHHMMLLDRHFPRYGVLIADVEINGDIFPAIAGNVTPLQNLSAVQKFEFISKTENNHLCRNIQKQMNSLFGPDI
jgi:hypothetical protein